MRRKKYRHCKSCGGKLESYNLWVCDACQGAGLGESILPQAADAARLLAVARARERMGEDPLRQMTIEEIALLARCFQPPYETYGKLRGYVYATGGLPPEAMERGR